MGDSGADSNAPGDSSRDVQGNAPGRRRQRNPEVQEVVDELTQETKRTTLLECVESQLKGKAHVSRLFFAFAISDDSKIRGQVDEDFQAWLESGGYEERVTGLLLYIGQAGFSLLEGPTELLFKALETFNTMTIEIPGDEELPPGAPGAPRPPLITGIRVLHFTELHGVRCSIGWCSHLHNSKLMGSQTAQLEEGNSAELVFLVYQKLLHLMVKVSDAIEGIGQGATFESLQGLYRKQTDMMPSADDTLILLSKNGADLFFNYTEFEKVFVAPFHCVLHSELLWPMPPALSY